MIEDLKQLLASYNGVWKESKGSWEFKAVIAERKAFLSKKKLSYIARINIDQEAKVLKFFEMLREDSSGLSSGGDFDSGISSGFGFKAESYNTLRGPREGNIQEQSNLFGKNFSYNFDYAEIRKKVEEATDQAGYQFDYSIMPI